MVISMGWENESKPNLHEKSKMSVIWSYLWDGKMSQNPTYMRMMVHLIHHETLLKKWIHIPGDMGTAHLLTYNILGEERLQGRWI